MICVAAVSCEKKQEPVPQAEMKTAVVPYRHSTSFEVSGESLKVDLREVVESRCPINAFCVQAGSAKVTFTVSEGAEQANVTVDFKGDKKADFQEFKLAGQNYVLSVSEVLPFPEVGKAPKFEDYKVNVTIEKAK